MFRTLLYSATGLMLAAGGPIAYYSAPEYWNDVQAKWFPADDSSDSVLADDEPSANPVAAIEGAPVSDLGELLRFDITPDWIVRRWPRVSTGLSHLQLQGYRVPMVTGTKETDLAGSLTYYFNSQQQVQRITFHGATGDPQHLVRLLTSRHAFARRLTNDPGLIVYEAPQADGQRLSLLKLTSVGVVKSSDPRRRLKVELSMERPS
ncbi:MAG TPA: DUF6690 family protein [Thermoguttaceae bacterium]|nr:DUF6690 family protein [Thermoguttaceae bacterium]